MVEPKPLHKIPLRCINLERREDRKQRMETILDSLQLPHCFTVAYDGLQALMTGAVADAQRTGQSEFLMQYMDPFTCEPKQSKVRLNGDSNEKYPHKKWGVLGCLLSHRRALIDLLETSGENEEYFMILEDDCHMVNKSKKLLTAGDLGNATKRKSFARDITKRFDTGFRWICENCPDWKLIHLGGVLGWSPKAKDGPKARHTETNLRLTPLLIRSLSTYQAHAYIIHRSAVIEVVDILGEGFATDGALLKYITSREGLGCFRFCPDIFGQPGNHAQRDSDILPPDIPALAVSPAPRLLAESQDAKDVPAPSDKKAQTKGKVKAKEKVKAKATVKRASPAKEPDPKRLKAADVKVAPGRVIDICDSDHENDAVNTDLAKSPCAGSSPPPPSSATFAVSSGPPPPSSATLAVSSSPPPPSSATLAVSSSPPPPSSATFAVSSSPPPPSSATFAVSSGPPPPSSATFAVSSGPPPPSSATFAVSSSAPPPAKFAATSSAPQPLAFAVSSSAQPEPEPATKSSTVPSNKAPKRIPVPPKWNNARRSCLARAVPPEIPRRVPRPVFRKVRSPARPDDEESDADLQQRLDALQSDDKPSSRQSYFSQSSSSRSRSRQASSRRLHSSRPLPAQDHKTRTDLPASSAVAGSTRDGLKRIPDTVHRMLSKSAAMQRQASPADRLAFSKSRPLASSPTTSREDGRLAGRKGSTIHPQLSGEVSAGKASTIRPQLSGRISAHGKGPTTRPEMSRGISAGGKGSALHPQLFGGITARGKGAAIHQLPGGYFAGGKGSTAYTKPTFAIPTGGKGSYSRAPIGRVVGQSLRENGANARR